MGAVMNDPIARAFTWSMIAFLLSAWAGWMLGRYRNPLAAFTPMIAVLAIVADYSGSGFTSLWLMLAGALIFMGFTRYDVDRIRWQRTGVDFSESIPVDTGAAIVVLTVALAALAWIMPSISVKAMAETIRDWGKSQDELAESFGLQPAPAPPSNFSPYIYPSGLPRSHLVGSGPELNRQIVMAIRTGELPPRPQISNPPPAPRHYWRSVTYDRYTGSGWLSSPVEINTFKADQHLLESLPAGYRELIKRLPFSRDLGGQLHWTGALVSVNRPYEVAWRSDPTSVTQSDPFGGMDLLGAISSVDSYSAVSFEAAFNPGTTAIIHRSLPSLHRQISFITRFNSRKSIVACPGINRNQRNPLRPGSGHRILSARKLPLYAGCSHPSSRQGCRRLFLI